eukprot:scaffold32221_cov71-Skeletonema_dohrnii-CCMP3373.AAC.1
MEEEETVANTCRKNTTKRVRKHYLSKTQAAVLVMIDVTDDTPAPSEPTKTYKHAVYPFPLGLDPRECNGYPLTYIKNEPEHELNFFLTDASDQTQQDEGGKKKRGRILKKMLRKEVKKNAYVKPERSSLACSLASRVEISFEQLQNQ